MFELYSDVKIYKYLNSYPEFIAIQIKAKTHFLYMCLHASEGLKNRHQTKKNRVLYCGIFGQELHFEVLSIYSFNM